MLRRGQIVFTYFHLAADRQVDRSAAGLRRDLPWPTRRFRDEHGRLPLLTPMSEVAGRMSIQEGAKYLERPQQGRGILLARRAGRRAGPHHHPRRRRGRGQRRADRRRLPRQHRPAGHQHGPPPLPRRHHAAQRHRAVQRPAHGPRATAPRRPGDRRRAGAGGQGALPGRARRPEADEAGQRDHRRGGGPGRLRGHHAGPPRTAIPPSSSTTCCIIAWPTCPARWAAPAPSPCAT